MNWRLWQRAKQQLAAVNHGDYQHDWVGHGYDRRCRRCYEREDGSLCRGRPEPIVIDAARFTPELTR